MEGPRRERTVIGEAVVQENLPFSKRFSISQLTRLGYYLDTLSCCYFQASPEGVFKYISVFNSKSLSLGSLQYSLCALLLQLCSASWGRARDSSPIRVGCVSPIHI